MSQLHKYVSYYTVTMLNLLYWYECLCNAEQSHFLDENNYNEIDYDLPVSFHSNKLITLINFIWMNCQVILNCKTLLASIWQCKGNRRTVLYYEQIYEVHSISFITLHIEIRPVSTKINWQHQTVVKYLCLKNNNLTC